MIDGSKLTVENFKNFVLSLERENLRKLDRDDKKQMVSKIVHSYEEAQKNDHR